MASIFAREFLAIRRLLSLQFTSSLGRSAALKFGRAGDDARGAALNARKITAATAVRHCEAYGSPALRKGRSRQTVSSKDPLNRQAHVTWAGSRN